MVDESSSMVACFSVCITRLLALHLALDGGLEVALAEEPRAEHAHVVREEADAPAERRPEEPEGERHQVQDRQQGDDRDVPEEVRVEAELGDGPAARPPIRVMLRRAVASLASPVVGPEAVRAVVSVLRMTEHRKLLRWD